MVRLLPKGEDEKIMDDREAGIQINLSCFCLYEEG